MNSGGHRVFFTRGAVQMAANGSLDCNHWCYPRWFLFISIRGRKFEATTDIQHNELDQAFAQERSEEEQSCNGAFGITEWSKSHWEARLVEEISGLPCHVRM